MSRENKSQKNSYSRGNVRFEEFTSLNREILLKILNWRNDIKIRQNMENSDIISKNEHFNFVESLKSNDCSRYWLIKRKGIECGVTYLHLKSQSVEEGEWGYYLSPEFKGSGLGLEIGFEAIHIFFENFNLEVLYGLVKESNEENIKMQEVFNFQLQKSDKLNYKKFVLDFDNYNELPKTFKHFKINLLNGKKSK